MRGGRHLSDLLEQLDVLARLVEVVVPEQRAEGCAAEDPELLLVHLLEHRALVELGRPLQVLEKVLLRDVQDLHLEGLARFAVGEEVP